MSPAAKKSVTAKATARKAPTKVKPKSAAPVPQGQTAAALQLWETGKWADLVALAPVDPRDTDAALWAAAGMVQQGRPRAAGLLLDQALAAGGDRQRIARILMAGVHVTLGRAALHMADDTRARRAFDAAANLITSAQQRDRTASAVEVAARTQIGDLEGARASLTARFAELAAAPQIKDDNAVILSSQIEILQHEMALIQQRGQMSQNIENLATSQLGQDVWVLEQTNHKRGGFFVEFGATDGIALSNSYLLETAYGWQGLCSEPNPRFFADLEKNRSCTVTRDCILGRTGDEVTFILADVYGGVADFADDDSHGDKRRAYAAKGNELKLKTISLDDYLEKYGAPRQIDYMSIDTEGSEYEILKNFSFDKWDVSMFTIEHNFTPQRALIRRLMEQHGYSCIEKDWDDWFIKDQVAKKRKT